MANKMLIDATHPEETRVVVVRGNRVEEFDFESASRRQLRGNIYLAKVTRVEPSLQAAFVDYGGNRHGFLAFSEIHPDYYQIPVADRQALIDEEERAHRDAEAEADRRAGMRRRPPRHRAAGRHSEAVSSEPVETVEHVGGAPSDLNSDDTAPEADGGTSEPAAEDAQADAHADAGHDADLATEEPAGDATTPHHHAAAPSDSGTEHEAHEFDEHAATLEHGDAPALAGGAQEGDQERDQEHGQERGGERDEDDEDDDEAGGAAGGDPGGTEVRRTREDRNGGDNGNGEAAEGEEEEIVESVGGADAMEEVPDRAPRYRRQYKIQEVIKRRQIMLVQVVKEERGTKGAALTTYLSLAGRYSVLMPNTARGGGISRKITNVQDRKRLKEVAGDLEVPEGMGVILRTAGASRTKTEIKRDFEYLLRAWETVRDLTLKSTAPTLVYEEGSLVKRSIRDLYNKDIDEVVVAGEDAYRDARDFMRMLMPSHAKNVKPYKESQPILTKYGIESQLDAMFSPVVQLRSGGYIVLNQTEALVAIDVNSGRATREHHIEDTALKTNLEASEEVSRQLRLRDLAGLIVIDFIDMDEKRNNRSVERRLKDCLKNDRARIQVGRISHFGLMEMSRQRIRTSVLESSTDKCPHCGGTGHVRSVSSVALQLLRMIEEQLQRGATHNIIARTRSDIALYVLNHKRAHLHELEHRFQITVTISADATINGQLPFVIEKGEQVHSLEQARALAAQAVSIPVADHDAHEDADEADEAIEEPVDEIESEEDEDAEGADAEAAEPGERAEGGAERAENGEAGRRRRRRRRRGRRGEGREDAFAQNGEAEGGAEGPAERAPRPEERAQERPHEPAHEQRPSDVHAEHAGEPFAGHAESDEHAEADGTEMADGAPRADQPNGDGNGDRRRRRRGRRGGRRNRREEGEAGFRPPEDDVPPIDEEVAHAVADFGGPLVEEAHHEVAHAEVAQDEVAHHEATHRRRAQRAHDAARETEGEAPAHRRGHREPAPVAAAAQAEAGAPAASAPEAVSPPAAPPKPRRSTVREPAPFVVGSAASAPAPVTPAVAGGETVPSHTPEPAAAAPSESSGPRRAGWWAKRIFGEKG
jgi:ribonuclease E